MQQLEFELTVCKFYLQELFNKFNINLAIEILSFI
jgi:hypothetical protein